MHRTNITPNQAMHRTNITPNQAMHRTNITPNQAMHRTNITPNQAMHRTNMTPNQAMHRTTIKHVTIYLPSDLFPWSNPCGIVPNFLIKTPSICGTQSLAVTHPCNKQCLGLIQVFSLEGF
jgi:hypothetical protein